ncbi:MAG: TolC family protein [Phycisphaeraceae bacterium]|nr:TolC family protein [Phycisphaeraceae bacterium]
MPTGHPHRSTLARSPAARLVALALLSLAPGACRSVYNPFTEADEDRARTVALSRLRELRAGSLDEYRREGPPQTPEEQTRTVMSRFAGLETVELTLEECRASTLERNLNLKVALIDPAIARERAGAEEAKFESTFFTRAAWQNFDSPTASNLDSAQSERRLITPGVRIPMRTGGNVTVSLPVSKAETDNQFSTLNPAYNSDLQFSISHELLRNAGRRVNTASIRIAQYSQQVSEAQTKLEIIRQLAAVDRAYWRLYQARAELDVRQQQYELAVAQLDRARRRVDAGSAPEIEVIRAQAGVADRLETIIAVQNALRLQQRELKRIINIPGLDVDSPVMLTPTSLPDPVEYVIDHAQTCQAALTNRMELLELELRLAADAASIDVARSQSLPLFTVDYTYRVNGLGRSMQDSFHTLQRNNFADWEAGLNFEIPLGNEAARSRLRETILTRIQRLATKEAREQAIRLEVLNAADTIDGTWQRILAARQSVILNTRALQAEQRQFDVGQSTSNDVLDAATRLADAQSAEIRALTDHQIAQIDLAFATGTLLGAGKVDWEPVARPGTGSRDTDPAETLPPSLLDDAHIHPPRAVPSPVPLTP